MASICVIGAGVVGLSTAYCIQRAIPNARLTVMGDKFLKETTSDIAAGVYRFAGPLLLSGRPAAAGSEIAQLSWDWLNTLERRTDSRDIGVMRVSGYDVAYPNVGHSQALPQYLQHVFSHKKMNSDELQRVFPTLPNGCTGWFSTTLLIECRKYMPWLSARITDAGGKIIQRHVNSFAELLDKYDVVVNCAGLGAQQLAGDREMYPIRGQMMRVDAKEIKHFLYIDDGSERPTYIYPTVNTVALGGTKQDHNGSTEYSAADRQHILAKCSEYMPSLQTAKIIGEVVGLRPHRNSLRIEAESVCHRGRQRLIVHNYGHGGNGVAWSYGSAVIAARLVSDAVRCAEGGTTGSGSSPCGTTSSDSREGRLTSKL